MARLSSEGSDGQRWDVRGIGCTRYDLVRVLLGLVLLAAAWLKAESLLVSGASPYGNWTPVLVFGELAFAGWLFSGRFPALTWWLALFCFGGFAVVACAKTLAGEKDCGCFGAISTPPWIALSIDLTAVAALLLTYRSRASARPRPTTVLSRLPVATGYALILVVAAQIGFPLVFADGSAGWRQADNSDPTRWIGERFPLLEQIDIGAELSSGEWTAVLHRHGCALCGETLKCLKPSDVDRGDSGLGRIALVELPPYADTHDVGSSQLVTTARLAGRNAHFLPVPTVVHLEDGRVISVSVAEEARASLLRILGERREARATAGLEMRTESRETIAFLGARE